ncbi:unnamed protein product [Microthlaspi erraticum]|uniref:Uncharacterized protein n=1 Tax=Microthlaspi erraticum TaxID=1685480 RepID=A0A6D2LL29_9BRAS|nr:unnamed protein product [Microthlaspi erraticum]
MEKVATEYFQNLFTSSQPWDFEDALHYVPTQVTANINQPLTKFPTTEEIQQAIKEINPDKAFGPDGDYHLGLTDNECDYRLFWWPPYGENTPSFYHHPLAMRSSTFGAEKFPFARITHFFCASWS